MKTPTPFVDIRTLRPGSTEIIGKIGVYDYSVMRLIPEPEAHIYIFIDGILINESITSPNVIDETYIIKSDENGEWRISSLDTFYINLRLGQTVTLKAQSPGKELSESTPPLMVGGSPTPYNLSVLSNFNEYTAPLNGESIVEGFLYGWLDLNTMQPWIAAPIDISVYIDSIKVGQVLPNKIVNKVPPFILDASIFDMTLTLLVGGKEVEASFKEASDAFGGELFTVTDNPVIFYCNPPNQLENYEINVYKNGILLTPGANDFDYTFEYDIKIQKYFIRLNGNNALKSEDYLYVEYLNVFDKTKYKKQSFVGNGSTQIFLLNSIPRGNSNINTQVWVDGLRLVQSTDSIKDYSINIVSNQAQLVFPETRVPRDGSNIIIQYIADKTLLENIEYKTLIYFGTNGQTVVPFYYENQNFYSPIVYKNGVRLLKNNLNSLNDYYILDNKIYLSTGHTLTSGDILIIDIYKSKIPLPNIIKFINNNENFKKYGVTASYNTVTNIFSLESKNTLELSTKSPGYAYLFNEDTYLFPGKNSQNEFYYYIDYETGKWRYSNLEIKYDSKNIPYEINEIPFEHGQHLQASSLVDDFIPPVLWL